MTKRELFELMMELYRHCGYSATALYDVEEDIQLLDLRPRLNNAPPENLQRFARYLIRDLKPQTCCLMEDELGVCYTMVRFPEPLAQECHCRILSLGPLLVRPVESADFQRTMQKHDVSPGFQADFLEFLNQIPLIYSRDLWNHYLAFYLTRLFESPPHFLHVDSEKNLWAFLSPDSSDYSVPHQPELSLKAIEERYRLESLLLHAVSAGQTEEAARLHYQFMQHRLAPRGSSVIRDRKNILITFNTLLRKAAERGGVHPLHIDNLSRQLAIQIESALSLDYLDSLSPTMVRKYCLLVKNYSRRPYSSMVQTCMDHIDFYYNSELSLSSLARMCSVSESHLCAAFKKETGSTITDYINGTRIRQALTLLNISSLSIGEIAGRCGFSDANYFSRIFKKNQGMTPREYRDRVHGKSV